MSARYEWADAGDVPITLAVAGDELGADTVTGNLAVVLGDPWASALVLEGTPEHLRRVADRISALIARHEAQR